MPGSGNQAELVPDFLVRVKGNDLSAKAIAATSAISVYESLEMPGMFTLRLVNWDAAKLQVTWSDDALFSEGNEVEIRLGYIDQLKTVLVGEVTGLEPEFCTGEISMLTVRGYDRRHRLMRGQKVRSFAKMKDSDIAQKIAREAGLIADVQDSKVVLEYVLQHNQTDLEFIQERAWRIGYEVFVDNKTLVFRPRQLSQKEILTLSLDKNLLEFYPRLTTLSQVEKMEVRSWNSQEKKVIVGQANLGKESARLGDSASGPEISKRVFGQSGSAIVDWPVSSQAEADKVALGSFNEMALAYITGDGVCVGQADLRAGTVVRVEGLGKRFSGLYYVTSTTHSYDSLQGYSTAFTFRRNAT